ncbi:MAG: signaling protein [Betaproteobacteria bacterium HGW-Betaproteobacteria-13]|jgi:EAL domain-containing protein (putative c-di-GMP-specific phosphodiesterase class I)|nr:MAG: signaling protein [Betaproteobacteria bacterium HGW-Betaproteobacteria-13]
MDAISTNALFAESSGRALRARQFLEGLPLARGGSKQLRRLPDGGVVGDWYGCELSSVFQPIVDPAGARIVGHEAFLRILGSGGHDLSPWTLFSANADDARLVALDRLARTVHALNFIASTNGGASEDTLLFLNVHGRLLAAVDADHGAAFRRVVDALGIAAGRIVIETPVSASSQPDLLNFVLRNYRQNGFQVAVNVESPAQWQALAAASHAQYIKVDGSKLIAESDAPERIRWFASLRGAATPILTRLESQLAQDWVEHCLVQGDAYGHTNVRVVGAVPGPGALG